MRKWIIFLVLLLMSSGVEARTKWSDDKWDGGYQKWNEYSAKTEKLRNIGGLTFFTDFSDGKTTLDADYANGSKTATFTATRASGSPGTYIDSAGVVQPLSATDDTARYNKTYYDSSGVASGVGLALEGEIANLITNTYGVAVTGNDWDDYDFATGAIAGTPTYSTIDATDLINISGATWQRIQYAGEVGDVEADQYDTMSITTADDSFAENDVATFSCWLKGSITGTITVYAAIEFRQNDGTTVNGESVPVTLTSEPQRISVTGTAGALTGECKPRIHTLNISENDAFDIYTTGWQVEKQAYPSSFIPTTASALTRGAEALSYATAGNFVGGTEGTILMKYRPVGLPAEAGDGRWLWSCNMDSYNGWRLLTSQSNDNIRLQTESALTNINTDTNGGQITGRYTSYTVIGTFSTTADGASVKQDIYLDGVQQTDTDANYTVPVGSLPSDIDIKLTVGQAMILETVVIFNRRLSVTEVATVTNILG